MNRSSRILFAAVLAVVLLPGASSGQKMTYEEARSRLQPRELPEFWVGTVEDLPGRWAKLSLGEVRQIAESPGGRPLHLISYGQHEPVAHRANFNSAIGGRDAASYLDKAARRKPVVYFVGPVHGHEVEGLTGLVNLIEILETGRDLRGREQPALRELAGRCRLLIVPAGNPDGTVRFEPQAIHGMPLDEFQFWGQGSWKDGSIAFWPGSKRQHPFVGPEIGWMGCYFNDKGINPMHDEFFAPMSTEAPAILQVALKEGPDLAVSLHSHGSNPAVLRPAYVPLEIQEQVRIVAGQVYELLDARGLPHGGLPDVQPEGGENPASFNLVSAVYHVSGAVPFTFECPHGVAGEKYCQMSLEQILDIQLSLYEAMLRFAIDGKAAQPPQE
jgi:hypothetical protein